MFNRVLLFVISLVSIIWIVYIGYDLLDRRDNISPQNIFGSKDGEVLIINRSEEVDLDQLNFKIHPEMKSIMEKIIASPNHHERLYISKKRGIVIIEMPNLWNKNSMETYFGSKNIPFHIKDAKEFSLENGIIGRYQRNFLLISTKYIKYNKENLAWPIWDNKASATIISLNKPLLSTDIYFKADGTVFYQTKYNHDINSIKIDDQDIFGEVLPNKLMNYHFYEKNFAVSIDILQKESPLFKWSETGFVRFDYNGKACIISDFKTGQDPLLVLNEQTSNPEIAEYKTKQNIKNIRLTNTFPNNTNTGFYLMYVADKVVISENLEACEQIVADYQLGKTIALSANAKAAIFDKLPRKVSERSVSGKISYTQSAYKNILVKTQISKRQGGDEIEIAPVVDVKEQNWSIPVDGEILQMKGRGSYQYLWTNHNQLIALSGKKKIWKTDLDGAIIGEPQLVDVSENGPKQILFNTPTSIYLIDQNGNNHEGFPIKTTASMTNPVSFYRWKNQGYFVVMNDNNQMIHFNEKGKELKVFKTSCGEVSKGIDVFVQNGNLIAVISGNANTQTINLAKYKAIKNHPVLPSERLSSKATEEPKYYSLKDGHLIRQEYNGTSTILGNYPNAKQMKLSEGQGYTYISFVSYNKIHVLNDKGIKLFQIDIPFKELAAYDVITLKNGKTYIAMIDAIENNLYLFDSKGKNYTPKPLEGKDELLLSEKGNGNLLITTSGNGFVVQYFDLLKDQK